MAKDKKQKAADKKARTAAKTEKKTKQKEKKAAKKPTKAGANDADSDAENVDLDAVLAEYAKAQEQYLKVTETVVDPPSARSSATLLGSPSNDRELLLFGGEYFDGALARFYNDLLIYNTRRDEWRRITSPNSPLPRSGHAWTRGGNAGGVWLFGGEFSSPKQGTFYHYSDFWRLDPGPREWTKIEPRGRNSAPPARSGHRMTFFKQYIVLFGGFQDTSSATRYLADLWLYDTANFTWHQPTLPPASPRPEPRSSFSFLPHEQGAVLAGGYSRVKTAGAEPKTKSKSSGAHRAAVLKPLVHTDTWFLRITPPAADAAAGTPPSVRWERRKKPTNAPAPPRAGATMAAHKGRGVLFGGVHDVEDSEEGIESEFFSDLYVWNIERNRFFSLALRRPRAGARANVRAKGADGERGGGGGRRGGKARADEQELLARLKALEARDPNSGATGAENGDEAESGASDSDDSDDSSTADEKPVLWEMPHARFNAALAVVHDVLYIYGGTFEKGEREYTFDEMYAVDLGKLDGVREVFRREVADWIAESSEDEDEDDEDEDDEDDDEEENASDQDEPGTEEPSLTTTTTTTKPPTLDPTAQQAQSPGPDQDTPQADDDPNDPLQADEDPQDPPQEETTPFPRPHEPLRTFYARTKPLWTEIELAALHTHAHAHAHAHTHSSPNGASTNGASTNSTNTSGAILAPGSAGRTLKEVRARAFARAEERWWGVREEVRALEDVAAEAGIGEVVSLEARGGAAGAAGAGGAGAGRRR